MQALREIICIKKWEINGAAGRYIRSHKAVQHISIRDRLDKFMQQHGDTLASILAPELMAVTGQTGTVQGRAVDRSVIYLREALSLWLSGGKKTAYCEQDAAILTAIGLRPDAASRADSQERHTPAQHTIYARRRADLTAQQPVRK